MRRVRTHRDGRARRIELRLALRPHYGQTRETLHRDLSCPVRAGRPAGARVPRGRGPFERERERRRSARPRDALRARPAVRDAAARVRARGSRTCRSTSTRCCRTATVALRGPWGGGDLVKIAPTASDLARGSTSTTSTSPATRSIPAAATRSGRAGSARAIPIVAYAHVVTEPDRPHQLALQYWFFYAFNDWNNLHEGDWEMIQLDLRRVDGASGARPRTPTSGRLQPARGRRARRLGRLEARARERHAPGRPSGRRLACELLQRGAVPRRVGVAGRRLRRHPRADVRRRTRRSTRSRRARRRRSPRIPWVGFQGRWGELQPAFFNGPTGPNLKTQWTKPVLWSERLAQPELRRPRRGRARARAPRRSSAVRSPAARTSCRARCTGPASRSSCWR